LQQLTIRDPDFAPAQSMLGSLYFQQRRHPEATAALQKAYAAEPDNTSYQLYSAAGWCITLPAANRGQGFATGGTAASELLVVVVVCAKAHFCEKASTARQDTPIQTSCFSPVHGLSSRAGFPGILN